MMPCNKHAKIKNGFVTWRRVFSLTVKEREDESILLIFKQHFTC